MKPRLPSTLAKEQYLFGLFTKRGSETHHTHKNTAEASSSTASSSLEVVPLEIQGLLPS